MSRRPLVLIALAALAGIAIGLMVLTSNSPQPANGIPALVHSYDLSPDVFTVQYPDGWEYHIPAPNQMVLEPQGGGNGLAVTIQRSLTLMSDSLRASLDTYLQRGPLFPNNHWTILGEVTASKFQEREAFTVDLRGKNLVSDPELRSRIVMTTGANGTIYVLVSSTPVDKWEQQRPLLDSILNSVRIVE